MADIQNTTAEPNGELVGKTAEKRSDVKEDKESFDLQKTAAELKVELDEKINDVRRAITESISNPDARKSKLDEIISSMKEIWSETVESGVIEEAFAIVTRSSSGEKGAGLGSNKRP